MKFFNLNNDVLFKSVFRNFKLLKKLAFDIWKIDISDYYYDNPRFQSSNKGLSNGEYDLLLTNGSEYLIFEMQNKDYGNFENRNSIYRSALISFSWEKGDKKYEGILPVKIYWLLNYSYHKKDLLKYKMLEETLYEQFKDGNEVHIFNIKNNHKSVLLNKYKVLFNAKSEKEIEALASDERVGDIAKKVLEYNMDPDMYQEMKRRDSMIIPFERELALARGSSFLKGKAEGEAVGKEQERKEIISNMLAADVPLDLISQVTNLPESQIQNYVRS